MNTTTAAQTTAACTVCHNGPHDRLPSHAYDDGAWMKAEADRIAAEGRYARPRYAR